MAPGSCVRLADRREKHAVAMVEWGSAKLACEPEAINLGATTRAGANGNDVQSLGHCLKHGAFLRRLPDGAPRWSKAAAKIHD